MVGMPSASVFAGSVAMRYPLSSRVMSSSPIWRSSSARYLAKVICPGVEGVMLVSSSLWVSYLTYRRNLSTTFMVMCICCSAFVYVCLFLVVLDV